MNNSLVPLLWFLAILALIPVVLWLLKRTPLGGAALGGQLRTVAQLVIAPSQRIVIVEVGQDEDRQWGAGHHRPADPHAARDAAAGRCRRRAAGGAAVVLVDAQAQPGRQARRWPRPRCLRLIGIRA